MVNRIRTQLQTFNPNKADFPQTQHWYKQHDSLAMEKEKLDEFATQQHSYINQAQTIEEQVDETLLGGLVVKLGARLYDTSLKSRLQRLQYAMKGAA